MFVPDKPLQPSLMFVGEARNLPYSGALGRCLTQAPSLTANIRLGWKGLPGTNTLAYYKNQQTTSVKSFIVKAPGVNTVFLCR